MHKVPGILGLAFCPVVPNMNKAQVVQNPPGPTPKNEWRHILHLLLLFMGRVFQFWRVNNYDFTPGTETRGEMCYYNK